MAASPRGALRTLRSLLESPGTCFPPPPSSSRAAASADPATAEPRADLLSHSSHKEKKNNYPHGSDVCLCEDAIAAVSIVSAA